MSVLALVVLATLGAARELEVPKNDGWVTDLADVISAAKEAELEELLDAYRQGTTHEIAVLTVPSLEGEPIENFALEVGRAWGMGTEGRNNAALLVVAPNDRTLRIEVARGLEGNLTDSISGRISRDVITPEFRKGRFEAGIEAGVRAMNAAIGGDYAALPPSSASTDEGVMPGFVALLVLLVLIATLARRSRSRGLGALPWMMMSSMGGGGFGRRSGGGGFGGFGGGGGFSGGGATGRW